MNLATEAQCPAGRAHKWPGNVAAIDRQIVNYLTVRARMTKSAPFALNWCAWLVQLCQSAFYWPWLFYLSMPCWWAGCGVRSMRCQRQYKVIVSGILPLIEEPMPPLFFFSAVSGLLAYFGRVSYHQFSFVTAAFCQTL